MHFAERGSNSRALRLPADIAPNEADAGARITMSKQQNRFLKKVTAAKAVRVTVRSLCISGDQILVQRPSDDPSANYAFIGGKLEYGETLSDRVRTEYKEELGLRIDAPRYLFAVENRFWHDGAIYHGLEHYFLVAPPAVTTLKSRERHLEFHWLPVQQLKQFDVRPHVVRDAVSDGSWRDIRLLTVPFDPNGPRT
jgi:8-oxo-dGTP diphosphatase